MKRNGFLTIVFAGLLALAACGDKDEDKNKGDDTEEPAGDPKPTEGEPAGDEPATDEPAEPAAGGEDLSGASNEELAERTLAYLGEIGQAAQAAEGDCDQVAKNFEELAAKDTAAPLMAEMQKREATMSEEEKKAFEEKFAPKAQEHMAPLMEVAMKCQEHEGVQNAVEKLMPEN